MERAGRRWIALCGAGLAWALPLLVGAQNLPQPASNDNFSDRIEIAGTNLTFSAWDGHATKETGEPALPGSPAGRSLWWQWTASADGVVTLSGTRTNGGVALGVFTGEALDQLTLVATNRLTPQGLRPTLTFRAEAGTTYAIVADAAVGYYVAPGSPFGPIWVVPMAGYELTLSLSLAPGAANDGFANRFLLSGTNALLVGDNISATQEPEEPLPPGTSAGQTVWWTWTAPGDGSVTIRKVQSSFDPAVTVFTGDVLADLSLVAANGYQYCWEWCGCEWRARPELTFEVQAGVAYQIAVDGYPATSPAGDFSLQLIHRSPPPNDNFADRLHLSGISISMTVSNIGATREAYEPSHAGNPGGSSIWFAWTAPFSGDVRLAMNPPLPFVIPNFTNLPSIYDQPWNSFGSVRSDLIFGCGEGYERNPWPQFAPIFAVYTGDSLETLEPVAVGTNLSFRAVAGTTYVIAFDGNQNTTGVAPFHLDLALPPSNDAFADAIQFSGGHVKFVGYNASASVEPGEPGSGLSGDRSVWWAWIAPVSGRVNVTVTNSNFSPSVSVLIGRSLSTLNPVATNASASSANSVTFDSAAGRTYYVRIDSPSGAFGDYNGELEVLGLNLAVSQRPTRRTGLNPRSSTRARIYTAVAGENVVFYVDDAGTGSLSFQWHKDGVAIPGARSAAFAIYHVELSHAGNYTARVNDGRRSMTRPVALLKVTPDRANPVVTVTHPTRGTRLTNALVILRGKAFDNVAVERVVYQLNSGSPQLASGKTIWNASALLVPGLNVLRVYAEDPSGNRSATKAVKFFLGEGEPLRLQVNGRGRVTADAAGILMDLGRTYTLRATPEVDHRFSHWTGSVTSASPTIIFTMQSNMVLVANFVPNPFVSLQGNYSGLFYPGANERLVHEANDIAVTNSGSFVLSLTEQGSASGKLRLAGKTYSFSRVAFDLDGRAHVGINRPRQSSALNLELALDLGDPIGLLQGTVSDGAWQSGLLAFLDRPSTDRKGDFPFVIQPAMQDDAQAPPSHGVVAVNETGRVRVRGILPDGTALSLGVAISHHGWCPLYLYSGRGMILGWIQFTTSADFLGSCVWIKGPEKHDLQLRSLPR